MLYEVITVDVSFLRITSVANVGTTARVCVQRPGCIQSDIGTTWRIGAAIFRNQFFAIDITSTVV